MKEKILYVSSESSLGGASQSLCDMMTYLKGYITPIVILPACGALEDKLNNMKIKSYLVPLSRGIGEIGQHTSEDEERDFRINYEAALKIKKIIEEEDIDLVHINSSVCNAGAIGALFAGVPYIWHMREIMEEQFAREFWDIEFKRLLFHKTNKFVTISKCVQDAYFCKYGITSQFIYDGIDSERYMQAIEKKDNYNFLVVGNISETKGQLDVIKAVRILKEQGVNDVHVYMVGCYSARFVWCLKKYIDRYGLEDKISLYSFTDDLADLRKKCAYAIIPSKFEALGRVTVEAMLAGNIVIGANTGGTLELVGQDKKKGYLYTQGSPESLALAMSEAMNEDADIKYRILAEAQSFALESFDTKKYADAIYNVYREVLMEKNTSEEEFIQYLDGRYAQYTEKKAGIVQCTLPKGAIIRRIEEKMIGKEEDIKRFLSGKNIENIAIYGMGKLGCKLYDMLEKLQYTISYVIDRDSYFINDVVKVFSPGDEIDKVDTIIITAIDADNAIKEKYLKEGNARFVLHLSELVEGNISIFNDLLPD